MLLRSPCKNVKPYDNPFWGFEQWYQQQQEKRKKRRRKRKIPKIVVYLSCSAGRTHFARTNLPPGYQGLANSRQFATWRSGLKQSRQFALGFGKVYIICHLEIWAWHNLPPGDQILHSLDNLRDQVCHRYILTFSNCPWSVLRAFLEYLWWIHIASLNKAYIKHRSKNASLNHSFSKWQYFPLSLRVEP